MTFKAVLSSQMLPASDINSELRIVHQRELYINSDSIESATKKAKEQLIDDNARVISISEMIGDIVY